MRDRDRIRGGGALSYGHVQMSWQAQRFRCRFRGRRGTFARSSADRFHLFRSTLARMLHECCMSLQAMLRMAGGVLDRLCQGQPAPSCKPSARNASCVQNQLWEQLPHEPRATARIRATAGSTNLSPAQINLTANAFMGK